MNRIQIWNLLAQRARARANDALTLLRKARQRIESLEKSAVRLDELHADYLARLQVIQGQPHGISENMNCRRYLAHVEDLKHKLSQTRAVAEDELRKIDQTHRELEADRVKMKHLADNAEKAERRKMATHDQAQLEKLAIARFNLR